MIVRKASANAKDCKRLIELLYVVANVHHDGRPDLFKKDSKKYDEEQLFEILEDENRPVFVCVDDKDYILGYAFCILMYHKDHSVFKEYKSLYIDDICVDENYRLHGVGKLIFEKCKEHAYITGCYNIELNVWEFNKQALRFYKSLGMETESRRMELII